MPSSGTIQRWAQAAIGLLPRGILWRPKPGGTLYGVLQAVGAEWAKVAERLARVPLEGDPRTAVEMLPEWEASLGLPSPCVDEPLDTPMQQLAAAARFTGSPGPCTAQDFIGYAATLGYQITVEEVVPWFVGVVGADAGIWSTKGVFYWIVHAPVFTVNFAEAGVSCAGDSTGEWSNELLECEIQARRPAHTTVLFVYDLPIQPEDYQPWPPFVQLETAELEVIAPTGAVAI